MMGLPWVIVPGKTSTSIHDAEGRAVCNVKWTPSSRLEADARLEAIVRRMNKAQRIAVVYQAGIANVFRVEEFLVDAAGGRRGAVRLLQGAFQSCEWFARGMLTAGCEVRSFACNRAGDVSGEVWSLNVEDAPFYKAMCPVGGGS